MLRFLREIQEMSSPELRRKWRWYFAECKRINREYESRCYEIKREWLEHRFFLTRKTLTYPPRPETPLFPDELKDLTCGARTRAGTPCKRRDLYISARCRLHGGLSTGPVTEEGKRRSALNGKMPKRKRPVG